MGWYLSATALGFYQYAYQLADAPATEIAETIASITFPAYSKLQGDPLQLREAFLNATRFTAFVTVPLAFGIVLVTPGFVPLVLGEAWLPMVVTMQILAIFGLLHALTRNFGAIWKAIGRPDYIAKLGFVRVVCIALLIWPATARWGIEGTALVIVGVFLLPVLPLEVYYISRVTAIRMRDVYREFTYPIAAGSIMVGCLWIGRALVDVPPLIELLAMIPIGVIVYGFAAFAVDRWSNWGMRRNLRTIAAGLS